MALFSYEKQRLHIATEEEHFFSQKVRCKVRVERSDMTVGLLLSNDIVQDRRGFGFQFERN